MRTGATGGPPLGCLRGAPFAEAAIAPLPTRLVAAPPPPPRAAPPCGSPQRRHSTRLRKLARNPHGARPIGTKGSARRSNATRGGASPCASASALGTTTVGAAAASAVAVAAAAAAAVASAASPEGPPAVRLEGRHHRRRNGGCERRVAAPPPAAAVAASAPIAPTPAHGRLLSRVVTTQQARRLGDAQDGARVAALAALPPVPRWLRQKASRRRAPRPRSAVAGRGGDDDGEAAAAARQQ